MDLWDKLALQKNKIFVIILSIIILYMVMIPTPDSDDPYIIYIEYDCRTVIKDLDNKNIPIEVINKCNEIIEERHESQTSKRSPRT